MLPNYDKASGTSAPARAQGTRPCLAVYASGFRVQTLKCKNLICLKLMKFLKNLRIAIQARIPKWSGLCFDYLPEAVRVRGNRISILKDPEAI